MKIEKKIWPKYFEKICNGEKDFEVRLNDYEYNIGDVLLLREWNPENKTYTGKSIEKTIKYIAKTKDMKYWTEEEIQKNGFVILGLK